MAMTLQIRKDLVQAVYNSVAPKLLKDKPSLQKLLDMVFTLSESLEKSILEGAGKRQDVFIIPTY